MNAELRAAPLPKPLNKIAVHLYINFYFANTIERWELWQSKNAISIIKTNQPIEEKFSHGHIYKNLKLPFDGVGGGPSFGIKSWEGEIAETIYQTTLHYSKTYQYRNRYLAWPGPNSNTFIANILKESKVEICLPATAIGKDYLGLKPHLHLQKNIFQFNVFTAGCKIAKNTYWEIHLAGLTLGYEKSAKQWKLPFGKGTFPYTYQERLNN